MNHLKIDYCFTEKLDDPNLIFSLKNSLKKVTEFHLLLYSDFNVVTFCKITSLLDDHIIKFCVFGYKENFKCILDFVERNKSSLRQIKFRFCHINDHDLESLSVVKGLDLTSFNLFHCTEITDFGFSKLCESQKNIMKLDISSCRLSDDAVFLIVKYLPKIKSLIMEGCSGVTDVSPFFIIIDYAILYSFISLNQCM